MVERTPNVITTVSGMQRQLQEMDLLSAGNSIRTSLLEAPLSRNVSMAFTQNNNDLSESVSGSGGDELEISMSAGQYERALQVIQQIKREMQRSQSNSMTMQGGKKGTASSLSNSIIDSKFLTSQSCSLSTIGLTRMPIQLTWTLGISLEATEDPKLEQLAGAFGSFGCIICQGFGHSRSDCLTEKKIKLLTKNQPVYIQLNKTARGILDRKQGIYNDKWLYGDLLGIGCKKQREYASTKATLLGSTNIISLVNVFSNELIQLSNKKCLYCDGFGHIGTDNVTVKLGKRTRVPPNAQTSTHGKTQYISFEDRCFTKHNLEKAMIGFTQSAQAYAMVMQQHRFNVTTKYAQNKSSLNASNNLTGVVSQFENGIMKIDEINPVTQQKVVDIEAEAKKFEDAAFANVAMIDAVAETRDTAIQQRQEHIADGQSDAAFAQQVDEQETDDQKKVVITGLVTKQFAFWDKWDRDAAATVGSWTSLSDFPYIFYKQSVSRPIPGQKTVAFMIAYLISIRGGFAGIDDGFEMTGVSDQAFQNFYVTMLNNPSSLLQALFKTFLGFLQAISLVEHVRKVAKSLSKNYYIESDIKSFTTVVYTAGWGTTVGTIQTAKVTSIPAKTGYIQYKNFDQIKTVIETQVLGARSMQKRALAFKRVQANL